MHMRPAQLAKRQAIPPAAAAITFNVSVQPPIPQYTPVPPKETLGKQQ